MHFNLFREQRPKQYNRFVLDDPNNPDGRVVESKYFYFTKEEDGFAFYYFDKARMKKPFCFIKKIEIKPRESADDLTFLYTTDCSVIIPNKLREDFFQEFYEMDSKASSEFSERITFVGSGYFTDVLLSFIFAYTDDLPYAD